MTLISKHPYSFLFAGAGTVLVVIALFARNNQSAPAAGYGPYVSVSAGNTLVNPGMSNLDQATDVQQTTVTQNSSSTARYVPILITQTNKPTNATGPMTIPPTSPTPTSAEPNVSDQLLKEVYSLIPSGIAMPVIGKPRTPAQQALFEYGNKAGLVVLTFENAHVDMAQVLKEWLADRMNAGKIADAQAIARDMNTAGQSLAALPQVPPSAASANQALGRGYEDAGDKLLAVVSAGGSDAALADAMKTYNNSADSFTSAYIALADIFSLSGVTFSASDPGSAFQFSF
jgi:hypothetical protein